jgi:UDP-glucose 4-epimerase
MEAMMVALVAGGAGFVGKNLIQRLLAEETPVLAIDNFSRGVLSNLGDIIAHPLLRIAKADIANMDDLRAAVLLHQNLGPIKDIWHLAANSDIPAGIQDPRVDLKDTFMTTFNLLALMDEINALRIYFASSSAIYGDLGNTLLKENVGPLFPISNYGAMKLASEALITAAAEKFLERALLFRFPNVVGVPATHGVILDFIQRLKMDNTRLQVLGNGTQQKSYLHVSDLIDAMLFLVKTHTVKIDAINIGPTDEGVSVATIAKETVAHLAPHATIEFGEGIKGWIGDVPRFNYSTDKIQALGWKPSMNSLAAIRRAIEEIALQESAP